MIRAWLPIVVCVPFVVAQQQLPPPIRALGERIAATANAGLQADADGGLRGGGADYRVRFAADGMCFEPALGQAAPTTAFVRLHGATVRRDGETLCGPTAAAPERTGLRTSHCRGDGIVERFDVGPRAVELSWWFATRPAGNGDLVVRYAWTSSLPAPTAHGDGLRCVGPHGGVVFGGVTGVDARGARTAGRIAFVDGGLELSLPGAFVDAASYPLVLDPTIGAEIPISGGLTYDDGEPDACYEGGSGRWFVVWRRTFSASDSDVRGQRLFANGQMNGTTIFFGSNGIVTPPRVASIADNGRFGVVWSQVASGISSVQFQGCEATTGALDAATTLVTSSATVHGAADIGSDPDAPNGSGRGFLIVYEDEDLDAIRVRRVHYDIAGGQLVASAYAVCLDGLLGPLYHAPTIARAAGPDGWLLLAVQRRSPLVGSSAIEAKLLRVSGGLMGIANDVATSSNDDLGAPDVDGYDGRWVVAHERGAGTTSAAVVVTPVQDAGFTQIAFGAPVTLGGTILGRADHPSVGFAAARTWIGYRHVATLPSPTTTLRVAAIDSTTCTNCMDPFTVGSPGGTRIVVATPLSGGATHSETSLAVWHADLDDVAAQRLQHYGPTGSIVDLGGGCGNAGTVTWHHAPGIGSSDLRCSLTNFPTNTIAAIFNFSPPAATLPCGACAWLPFVVTQTPANGGGIFNARFAIPCLPALVGAQFDTQWTVVDLPQAPCAAFPGFVLSARSRLTIGQ
jgi:hypothetical protein